MREGTKVAGALGSGVLAISSAATVILLAAPLPPLSIAAGRVTVTGAVMLALGAGQVPALIRAFREDRGTALRTAVAGALLALHFGAWIASLSLTTVLRSTALVALQPVFAGLLGRLLGDRVSPWLYAGAAVSVAGTWWMTGGSSAGGSLLGDGLALLGGAAAAGYLAVGRSVRDAVPLRPYFGAVNLVAAGLLLAVLLATGGVPSDIASRSIVAVLYLGLVPGVVGHGLFNWVVRRAPIDRVAMVLLLEPVGASLLAWVVLRQPASPREMLGAVVVLVGVGIGIRPTRAP